MPGLKFERSWFEPWRGVILLCCWTITLTVPLFTRIKTRAEGRGRQRPASLLSANKRRKYAREKLHSENWVAGRTRPFFARPLSFAHDGLRKIKGCPKSRGITYSGLSVHPEGSSEWTLCSWSVTWYKNTSAGEQETHWDKTNKELTSSKMVIFFICLVPVRSLLTRKVFLYHVTD